LNADKVQIRNGGKTPRTYYEIKGLYRKAGVDSGYLIAFNKMVTTKALVAKKYKVIITSKPEMWEKVTKELTSSVPKPPPLHLIRDCGGKPTAKRWLCV